MGKESLIVATVASSLSWEETSERAVDRITALAWAQDALGSLVLRAMANDALAYQAAISMVAKAIRRDCVGISASRVAATVLAGFLDQRCRSCGGRGVVYSDKLARTCQHCLGTRLQDTRRSKAKVGGRTIPDAIFAKAYGLYADSLATVCNNATKVLTNE